MSKKKLGIIRKGIFRLKLGKLENYLMAIES